ncbi:MAG: leucine-rich repeat domain-containing protein [Eggerthellaceae bacterium]|nr:leucine-rich repeat domain-containing protein [Eggerthellaceae bacterium]
MAALIGMVPAAYAQEGDLQAVEVGLETQTYTGEYDTDYAVAKNEGDTVYIFRADSQGNKISEEWGKDNSDYWGSAAKVKTLFVDSDVRSLAGAKVKGYAYTSGGYSEYTPTLHNTFTALSSVTFLLNAQGTSEFKNLPDSCFSGEKQLTTLNNFDKTVVNSIPRYAFENCTMLPSVKLPDTVELIDGYAFQGCTHLETIDFGAGLKEIGTYAFSGCTLLGNKGVAVDLPVALTTVGESAFKNCEELTKVILRSSAATITPGLYIFYGTPIADTKNNKGSLYVSNRLLEQYKTSSSVRNLSSYADNIHGWLEISEVGIAGSYTGSPVTPAATVTWMGDTLYSANGANYTLEYANNVHAGTATVTVTGKGIYAINYPEPDGTRYIATDTKEFTIYPTSIQGATVTGFQDTAYDSGAIVQNPKVSLGTTTLVQGRDYEIVYTTTSSGLGDVTATITGIGNYKDTIDGTYSFKVVYPMSKVAVENVSNVTYNGSDQTPKPALVVTIGEKTYNIESYFATTMKNSAGKTVTKAVDAGTYTLTFTGTDLFTGTTSKTFKVNPAKVSGLSFSSIGVKKYTGKAVTPSVTVKNGSKKLAKGTDYTLSYKDNKAMGHNAKVIVSGKGNYTGSKTVTFTINKKGKDRLDIAKEFAPVGAGAYLLSGSKMKKPATLSVAKTFFKSGSKPMKNFVKYYNKAKMGNRSGFTFLPAAKNVSATTYGDNKVKVSFTKGSYDRRKYPKASGTQWDSGSSYWILTFDSQDFIKSGTLYGPSGKVVVWADIRTTDSGNVVSQKKLCKAKF